MNLGDLLLRTAFAAALGSALLYAGALRGRRVHAAAPWAFVLQATAVTAALALLLSYFLGHRFEFAYVAQYSARAMSPALTVAASWAGQEGSILLWAVLLAWLGLALARQPGTLVRPAMFFVSLAQAFLLVLLLVRGPFARSVLVPADGNGLNPLLEDPWMVAHPPVLFLGYAALAVPFALAAAALVRQDYRSWQRMVWPWALFAMLSLGVGIALGGIWAYKVLGWGGFWGWDPVENASLVPWLTTAALLHGLLIQRTTGALARTNLLLGLLGWILVLGGTYLTRSGVLQDFSVHSFAESGINTPLITFLVGSLAVAAALLAARWRTVDRGPAPASFVSRESALWLGLVTVSILAALVTVGTTAPLLTALAGQPATVQAGFYNMVSLPFGILLALLMALAPVLRWSKQSGFTWVRAILPGVGIGVVCAALALAAGMRDAPSLGILGAAGFALGVNAQVAVQLFRRGWAYGAGHLGHVGIAAMILGIVISGTLGRTQKLHLYEGDTTQALGYRVTYQGVETDARGRQRLKVHVEKGSWQFDARPVLMESPQTGGMIRTPAISGARNLYISPLEVHEGGTESDGLTWIERGHEIVSQGVGYTFTGFRIESHENLAVFADLSVRTPDGRTVTASPGMHVTHAGQEGIPANVDGLGPVTVAAIDADNGRVALALPGGAVKPGAAALEVSTKPFIHLVWIGALLALLGTALAGMRRAAEAVSVAATKPRRVAVARRGLEI